MITVVYIILGVVLLFFGLQYSIILGAKKSKGKKVTGLKGKLKGLERNGSRGLIYFYTPTCRACKMQTPIIKELQSSNRNVFDVDISKDTDTAGIFGVKATPMTVVLENGVISQVLVGVKQKDVLRGYLK